MPEPEPDGAVPSRDPCADDAPRPMTREEWIAYHVARAPKITPKQWAETLILLHARENDDDEGSEQEKAS
jgi:hypothetical protein